jgi:large subunit ribosomal protein L21
MYAVIETGGKQYRVKEGDLITVERLKAQPGEVVKIDKVLALADNNGLNVGTPYIDGSVTATVVENGKGKKVVIFKYKAKKDYRKKTGHRQPYTLLRIESLTGEAPQKSEADTVEKEAQTEVKRPSLKSMKKSELIAYARENNIEIDEKATNAVLIETIEAGLK